MATAEPAASYTPPLAPGAEIPRGDRICRHLKRKWLEADGLVTDRAFADRDHKSSADWLTGTATALAQLRRLKNHQPPNTTEKDKYVASAAFTTDFVDFAVPVTLDPVNENPFHVVLRLDKFSKPERKTTIMRLLIHLNSTATHYYCK
jgi:hypothetical protein